MIKILRSINALNPLTRRLANGTLWSFAGTLVARASGVLSMVLIARLLGKEGVGELAIIQSTVGIFSAFAGMGMGLTATKYLAQYKDTDKDKAGAILKLSAVVTWISGAILTVIMFIFAPMLANNAVNAPHLAQYIQIGSLMLLFGSVSGAQLGALAGFEAFRTIARVNVFSSLLNFPILIIGTYYMDIKGAVFALVVSQIITCIIGNLSLRAITKKAEISMAGRMDRELWPVVWKFSLPSVLCNIILGSFGWICSAILVNQKNGYAEMGIFNVTLSWFGIVSFMPNILGQVLLPMLSSQTNENNKSSLDLIKIGMTANAIVVVPLTLVISSISPWIMGIYGSEFREGWLTLIFTVSSAAVQAIQSPLVNSLTAKGHMWIMFGTYFFYGACNIILTANLVSFGAEGVAGARIITSAVTGIVVFSIAKSITAKEKEL